MKKKSEKFKLSLCNKIILIIVVALLVCTILWTIIMFFNMASNAKDVALATEKTNMLDVSSQFKDVEETCYLVQQIILHKQEIYDYIAKVQKNKDLNTVDKIEFYNTKISSIDYMININPYINNVRLFVNANITEKEPSFYNIEKMKQLSFYNNYKNNEWVFDYKDTLNNKKDDRRLAAILTDVYDDDGKKIAVLEVSTDLNNLFSDFYNNKSDEFSCFVSDEGKIYSDEKKVNIVNKNKKDIYKFVKGKKSDSILSDFNDKSCVVSTLRCSSLKGTYVHADRIDLTVSSYYKGQLSYFAVVIASTIIFIIIIVFIIKNSFARFNRLTVEVSNIKNGTVKKLTEKGNDEISELGKQINSMINSLEKLNQENINRELLAKNAEIRSLQNQINAHFMYNVLETIKMMAEIKEEYDISDAVTTLGNMFRYSMQWSSGMVELEKEINNIKNYLELMNLRQDYEIYLSLNIPKELMKVKIPKMSLQPLVENSVCHGIEDMAEDTSIYIKSFVKDDCVIIEVSDLGVGMSEEKLAEIRNRINDTTTFDDAREHGRALYNVQQRIKMYFGKEYGLSVYSQEGAYTKISIQIPLDKEKTL